MLNLFAYKTIAHVTYPCTFLIDDFSVEFMFTCPSFFVLFFFPNVLCNVYFHTQLLLFIKEFVSYDSKLFSVWIKQEILSY